MGSSNPAPAQNAAPSPSPAPAAPEMGGAPASSSEKPFDDTPFNAGVEADEESDPKKFIEQLTGKLGQSLRKYNQNQGQPDFALEKFAVNSVLAATHTGEMTPEDQKEIIKKVEGSGKGGEQPQAEPADNAQPSADAEVPDTNDGQPGDEEPMNEMAISDHNAIKLIKIYDEGDMRVKQLLTRMVSFSDKINRNRFLVDVQEELNYDDIKDIFNKLVEMGVSIPQEEVHNESFMLDNPKKNNMFQPGSNDILNQEKIKENLDYRNKFRSFVNKAKIKSILTESLNLDDMQQPETKPQPLVKPTTKPAEPAKPSRKNKPFQPVVTPGVRPDPKASSLREAGKSNYEIYHNSFSSAVQTAAKYAELKGYTIVDDHWFNQIATGPKRPSEGNTNRYSIELEKDGKLQKKQLHIQVYGMGNKYELNCYIS